MKVKISYHIMPYEIDYALLSYIQLKKSQYYLPSDVEIEIDTVMNMSDYLIDWDKTILPKEFFKQKFNVNHLPIIDSYSY